MWLFHRTGILREKHLLSKLLPPNSSKNLWCQVVEQIAALYIQLYYITNDIIFSFYLVNRETMWFFLHFRPLSFSFHFIQRCDSCHLCWMISCLLSEYDTRKNGYFARAARIPLPRTDRVFCIVMHNLLSPIVCWVFEMRKSFVNVNNKRLKHFVSNKDCLLNVFIYLI